MIGLCPFCGEEVVDTGNGVVWHGYMSKCSIGKIGIPLDQWNRAESTERDLSTANERIAELVRQRDTEHLRWKQTEQGLESAERERDELRKIIDSAPTVSCRPFEEIIELKRALAEAQRGLRAVETLISDSRGVDGLHRNGDVAPWDELRTGGRFEEWLKDFDSAIREEKRDE